MALDTHSAPGPHTRVPIEVHIVLAARAVDEAVELIELARVVRTGLLESVTTEVLLLLAMFGVAELPEPIVVGAGDELEGIMVEVVVVV